jgi:hypothetical protein
MSRGGHAWLTRWANSTTNRSPSSESRSASNGAPAKPRYPLGSTASAQVERMFPFNHEYWTRFTVGDSQHWSGALLP